jgi:hypothetical protein
MKYIGVLRHQRRSPSRGDERPETTGYLADCSWAFFESVPASLLYSWAEAACFLA